LFVCVGFAVSFIVFGLVGSVVVVLFALVRLFSLFCLLVACLFVCSFGGLVVCSFGWSLLREGASLFGGGAVVHMHLTSYKNESEQPPPCSHCKNNPFHSGK
jgi:hypothetical protein